VITTEEKFLFNMHVFDAEKEEPKEEDLIPPPPMFTEEELVAAKNTAFEEGRKQGIADEKAKRADMLTHIMGSIAQNTGLLFQDELTREKIFETESLTLATAIFEKLFPTVTAQHGFTELQAAILKILQDHAGKQKIAVFVQPDYAQDIETFLKTIQEKNSDLSFSVTGDPALSLGASSMKWEDGGAIRNTAAMAEEIHEILKDTLAGRATKSDDR